MWRYITSSLISCACSRTNGRLAVRCANAYSTLRRSTRFDGCASRRPAASGSITMPPSGIGAPVSRFPELAEVDDLLQPLLCVGEPVLVNDQPGVELAAQHAPLDRPRTPARSCLRAAGKARPSRKFAVVYLPGIAIRSPPAATSSRRDRALRDEQRPAVPPERAAGIEQHVVVGAVRVGVIAQLGDVDLARRTPPCSAPRHRRANVENSSPSRSMRRLTIASNMKQSFGQGEKPSDSFMRRPGCAAPARQARDRRRRSSRRARFRRSTMFETARTCANGGPWIEARVHERRAFHALDLRRRNAPTTAAIDRSLPWTVFTVMPRTARQRAQARRGWRACRRPP